MLLERNSLLQSLPRKDEKLWHQREVSKEHLLIERRNRDAVVLERSAAYFPLQPLWSSHCVWGEHWETDCVVEEGCKKKISSHFLSTNSTNNYNVLPHSSNIRWIVGGWIRGTRLFRLEPELKEAGNGERELIICLYGEGGTWEAATSTTLES